MEKIYPLLNWLEIGQAVDWLQRLTESPVTPQELISLCDAKQCAVYVDIKKPLKGSDEDTWILEVTGHGIQKIRNPMALVESGMLRDGRLELLGRATWKDEKGAYVTESIEWDASAVMVDIFPIFKPADIQALARKMNGAINQPTADDIEALHDQLKKACEAKENALYLTDKYKAELEVLRETAEQDRSSSEAAWLRAEQAESQANELRSQLGRMAAKAESCFSAYESHKALASELSNELSQEQMARKHAETLVRSLLDELEAGHRYRMDKNIEYTDNSSRSCKEGVAISPPSAGITFPYTTKQLEAMRDAALAYWVEHDRSKPAPYGIQKTVASFLSARIGDNPRKLPELAGAIKPDDLPKG
jgi:hypothetical protein